MSVQQSKTPFLRRAAALGLCAGTLWLSACTGATPTPEVSDAPEVTTGTVRIAAIAGDDDAALQARASVMVLAQAGFDASLSEAKDLSAARAGESLGASGLDVVFGPSEAWLAGLPQPPAATPGASASGSASASASASDPSASASAPSASKAPTAAETVPADQQAAREATQARLGQGLAIGTVAQPERRLVMAASRSVAQRLEATSIETLATHCQDLTLAAGPDWLTLRKEGFAAASGCTPGQERSASGAQDALHAVAQGEADVALLPSDDPAISTWGLKVLEDPAKALPADPVLGVISSERVGKDALGKLGDVANQLQGEPYGQLTRLASEGTVTDADLGRWLVQRGLLKGDGAGNPLPATPTASK